MTTHPSAILRRRAAACGVPIVEKPLLGSALIDVMRESMSRAATRRH
jgi:hypothetical protein